MRYGGRVEYAEERKIRERNTRGYRAAHWPIWIWVFFLAPGPLTFGLFAHGFGRGNLVWLLLVLAATGVAALRGSLPGAEPRPYILRFDEDRPNPLYRRVCYTFAWNAVLSFALLNLAGLAIAAVTGVWYMKQIYLYGYAPVCAVILLVGLAGRLPRAGTSTLGEGTERRYFYGAVWSVTIAQTVSASALADDAAEPDDERGEAGGLRRDAGGGGRRLVSRCAAEDAAYRAGRADRCGLKELRWSSRR